LALLAVVMAYRFALQHMGRWLVGHLADIH
jgi:hypothetical protein